MSRRGGVAVAPPVRARSHRLPPPLPLALVLLALLPQPWVRHVHAIPLAPTADAVSLNTTEGLALLTSAGAGAARFPLIAMHFTTQVWDGVCAHRREKARFRVCAKLVRHPPFVANRLAPFAALGDARVRTPAPPCLTRVTRHGR